MDGRMRAKNLCISSTRKPKQETARLHENFLDARGSYGTKPYRNIDLPTIFMQDGIPTHGTQKLQNKDGNRACPGWGTLF